MGGKQLSEEEYIPGGNPEVTGGENTRWVRRLINAFPALNNRNYQFYFAGQLISLIGTWLQIVAQGWLVLQLTNSVFQVGVIMALSTLPTLFLTLFGGVIVDRFPKKKILLWSQSCAMFLAFLLGFLTVFKIIEVWQIGAIAFILGIVNAVDAPARQAFVSEMVTKEQLSSAIALNSGIFNAARVIGPGLAGILIALTGTGGAFLINGASYIAVILALLAMRVTVYVPKTTVSPVKAIKEGIHYSLRHPIIRTLILFVGIVSVFGWSYTTVMPVIAREVFHMDAAGLGYLYAASGLGSLLGAFMVGAFSQKISPLAFIFGGNIIFTVSMLLFSITSDFNFAIILLFFSGFGLLCQAATINTTIQRLVLNEFRGRVMSIYILMFIGLTPFGNLQMGFISEHLGTSFAIRLGATIVFLFGIILFVFRKKIHASYQEYQQLKSDT